MTEVSAYAAPNDVRVILTRDLDRPSGTAASMPDAQLEAAVQDAQGEVDAQLGARYRVPFAPVPQLVKTITVVLAAWSATMTYYQEKRFPDDTGLARRAEWARNMLAMLRAGDVDLGDDDGPGGDPGPTPGGNVTVGAPVNLVPDGLLTGCWPHNRWW